MKRRLSLLLAVVMAVTMVFGMSMTAMAYPSPTRPTDAPESVKPCSDAYSNYIFYVYSLSGIMVTVCMYDKVTGEFFQTDDTYQTFHFYGDNPSVGEYYHSIEGGVKLSLCDTNNTPQPQDPDPKIDPTPQPEQPKAPEEEPTPQFVEENYVPNIVQNDKTQFGNENEGNVPSGAYNFSAYVSPSGFAKGVEKIADKKDVSGNITVYSGKPLTINKELLNTLTAKNMSMTYFFNYGGHLYSVTIPSGVNPALVLDKNGHGGPLYVGWLLGTSRLIK